MTDTRAELEFMDVSDLNEDEKRVLEWVAEGIRRGREVYGPLDITKDPRDWHKERMYEARDWMFYAACEDLKRKP